MSQGFAKQPTEIPIVDRFGSDKVNTTEDTTNEFLLQVLQELRLLNLHQSIVTDTIYTTEDL